MPRRRRWRGTVHAGLDHTSTLAPNATSGVNPEIASALPEIPPLKSDLVRLGLVLLCVFVLLGSAVWFGQRSAVLDQLGSSLYTFLGF